MRWFRCANEKLTSVGVGPQISHGNAILFVVEGEWLVRERVTTKYAGGACPISLDKVASLYHKILDNAMERTAFVTHRSTMWPMLASAKLAKVFYSSKISRYSTGVQTTEKGVETYLGSSWNSSILILPWAIPGVSTVGNIANGTYRLLKPKFVSAPYWNRN